MKSFNDGCWWIPCKNSVPYFVPDAVLKPACPTNVCQTAINVVDTLHNVDIHNIENHISCTFPPPPSDKKGYTCDETTYKCKEDSASSQTLTDCAKACKAPTPTGYTCDESTFQCKSDPSSTKTLDECTKICQKSPPTPAKSWFEEHELALVLSGSGVILIIVIVFTVIKLRSI